MVTGRLLVNASIAVAQHPYALKANSIRAVDEATSIYRPPILLPGPGQRGSRLLPTRDMNHWLILARTGSRLMDGYCARI